jgi:hypothetical protein
MARETKSYLFDVGNSGRPTSEVEYCTIYLNDVLKPRHIFTGDTREVEEKKKGHAASQSI